MSSKLKIDEQPQLCDCVTFTNLGIYLLNVREGMLIG